MAAEILPFGFTLISVLRMIFESVYSLGGKSNAPQDSITRKIERLFFFFLQPIHVILLEENFEIYAPGSEMAQRQHIVLLLIFAES